MNKWIGTGRLSGDPEVRYSKSGSAVAKFSLAINDGYGDKQKTVFIPIVAFQKLGEIVGNNLNKGSQVLVEGRIQIRNYEAQDGSKRYVTEVIAQNIEFLGSKPQGQGISRATGAESFGGEVFPDEDIPF